MSGIPHGATQVSSSIAQQTHQYTDQYDRQQNNSYPAGQGYNTGVVEDDEIYEVCIMTGVNVL